MISLKTKYYCKLNVVFDALLQYLQYIENDIANVKGIVFISHARDVWSYFDSQGPITKVCWMELV